jgi:4-amino-4-deoxy-L-arabinose transferase-like glycosyltransferase
MRRLDLHLDPWLESHLVLVTLLVIGTGFVLRAVTASTSYLNPDEALHFLLANQSDITEVYKQSLTNAHPPLFFLLIHFWRLLGNSEFVLRMLPMLAGTLSLWIAYKWLRKTFGQTAGLIGLVVLAFAPTMISVSAELRGYTTQFLFIFTALYFLERAREEKSIRIMVLFSLFLYLAILTHYSTLWVALALGIYFLVCIFGSKLPAKIVKVWLGFQAGAAFLYAFLYVTHIAKLRGSAMEQEALAGWLRTSYFHPDEEGLLLFALKGSLGVFAYLFSSLSAGIILFLLFLVGIVLLLFWGVPQGQSLACRRDLGFLLLFPFVIGCAAAIAGVYPYGGTRHVLYLFPFSIVAVSVALVKLLGKRIWVVLVASVVIMPVWNLYGVQYGQHIEPQNQRRELMIAAIDYIRQSVPPGGLLFVDYQTGVLLGYYLGKGEITRINGSNPEFFRFTYGGYQVISTNPDLWTFKAENFGIKLNRMAQLYGLNPGESVWVVDGGWGDNLHTELVKRFPGISFLGLRTFGDNIVVFQAAVGSMIRR